MADNVSITSGSGTNVAADDIAGVYYQRVKLTLGPDGTATGDAAGRLIGTDMAQYVENRPDREFLSFTPTINTVAYTSGDCLGGLVTVPNAARYDGAGGVINSITVLDKTQAQRAAFDIMLFNTSVTSAGNNNPVAFSDADMLACQGIISVLTTDYNTAFPGVPLNSVAFKPDTKTNTLPHNMAIPYRCVGGTSLYVQLVVRGTPTYTSATDLVLQFCVTLD